MSQYVNCHMLTIFPVKTDSTNMVVCIIKRHGVAFQSSLAHVINFNYGMILEVYGWEIHERNIYKSFKSLSIHLPGPRHYVLERWSYIDTEVGNFRLSTKIFD